MADKIKGFRYIAVALLAVLASGVAHADPVPVAPEPQPEPVIPECHSELGWACEAHRVFLPIAARGGAA